MVLFYLLDVSFCHVSPYVCADYIKFPLPLGAWDGLRYFVVALPEPSI